MSKPIVLAVTGASGSIYAVRLLEVLLAAGRNVHLTISDSAAHVIGHELGLKIDLDQFDPTQILPSENECTDDNSLVALRSGAVSGFALSSIFAESDSTPPRGSLSYHHYRDFSAGIASGSFLTQGMVICPCSMGTLGSIANGLSANLIHRAADVHLKEQRKLVVVPRETPIGSVQLDNMRRLADAGAVVLPAMPGFYHKPTTIHDLVDFIVARICDQLAVRQDLMHRWGDGEK